LGSPQLHGITTVDSLMLKVGFHLGTLFFVAGGGGSGLGGPGGPGGPGSGRLEGRQAIRGVLVEAQVVPLGLSMHTPPWSSANTATAHPRFALQRSQHFSCAATSVPKCRRKPGGVMTSVQSTPLWNVHPVPEANAVSPHSAKAASISVFRMQYRYTHFSFFLFCLEPL